MADLGGVFSTIGSTITNEISETAYVTDVIDSRFVVTDAEGNALSNGASVGNGGTLHIENNSTYITWEVTKDDTDENDTWTDAFIVRAKDDFFGGNLVPNR